MKNLLALVLLTPVAAAAQSTYFEEDFTCYDAASFGSPAGIYGWQATFSADSWTGALNEGVSPTRDEGAGSFGAPVDDYESFLLTGHPSWSEVVIEATIENSDDDAMGLVLRYAGPQAYYACYATKQMAPACPGDSAGVGTRVAIIRVDSTQACSNGYVVAEETTFAYAAGTPYRFHFEARGGAIRCSIDSLVSLSFDDPSPLGSGLAGLYNFDNGEPSGGVIFDDVLITGFDPDADGDGLPDAVEAELGTDPNDRDTDDDTISDRDEALMPAYPPNQDGDAYADPLDADSDGDGIPDRLEADDRSVVTPPRDTDCDGWPDYRDQDSDNDGIPDNVDTCILDGGAQLDTDGDGVGDTCDPAPNDPMLCGDVDADGCDDCTSGSFDPLADGPDADANGACDSFDDDGDGIPTSVEMTDGRVYGDDPDGDGIVSWLDPDADGDGVPDVDEGVGDDDGDGVPNYLDPNSGSGATDTPEDFVDANQDGIDDRLGVGGGGFACSAGGAGLPLLAGLLLLARRKR